MSVEQHALKINRMQRLILSRTSQRIVYKGLILFWEVTTFDSFLISHTILTTQLLW